jgi:hypothetical protein
MSVLLAHDMSVSLPRQEFLFCWHDWKIIHHFSVCQCRALTSSIDKSRLIFQASYSQVQLNPVSGYLVGQAETFSLSALQLWY